MTVIAMTREMGSRGREVALELAEQLGLKVIHHELIEQNLAARLNLPESMVHRFLEGKVSLFERWKINRSRLSLTLKKKYWNHPDKMQQLLVLRRRPRWAVRAAIGSTLLRSQGNINPTQ
jgi:hypothetical protein